MYNKITLPNGVRVVTEHMPYVRSATVGIWVGNGSRYEPSDISGMSHFIEHMIFKGTETRSAKDIAREMDAIGGQVNAFTTKECTCYYLKTLDTHLKTGVSILADMFLNSKFDQQDLELERGVILEEIDMYEDSPEDVATEKLFESCFNNSRLGRPILGTEDTLFNINSENMHQYMKEFYRPEDTIVSLAGSFDKDDIDLITELFSGMSGEGRNTIRGASYTPQIVTKKKDIEQNHICIGFEGMHQLSEDRYAVQLISSMLGGGMSSRLFQSVREQKGLCYAIYSFNASHEETGMFSIYTALNKSAEETAIKLIREVITEFCENGPSQEELDRCREQIKTNIYLSRESTSSRMTQLGKHELVMNTVPSIKEIMAGYDAVTIDKIQEVSNKIFDFKTASICAVGKVEDVEVYKNLIR